MNEKMPWQMTRTEWESETLRACADSERLEFLYCGLTSLAKCVTYDQMLRHHNMVAE